MGRITRGRSATLASIVGALALSTAGVAQSPTPVPPGTDRPEALVTSDQDWCDLFTDGGTLMPLAVCVARLALLAGDATTRVIPRSLSPQDPVPAAAPVTRKGRSSGQTLSFVLAAGSYQASVRTRDCERSLYTALYPRDDRSFFTVREFGDGTYLHDVAEDEYTIEVIGVPKGRRPCRWSITLTPAGG